VNAAADPGAESGESGRPREIPVGEIERSPFQTRTRFDEVQLAELAASI
jgi:ParB family chromosome partitioning protein